MTTLNLELCKAYPNETLLEIGKNAFKNYNFNYDDKIKRVINISDIKNINEYLCDNIKLHQLSHYFIKHYIKEYKMFMDSIDIMYKTTHDYFRILISKCKGDNDVYIVTEYYLKGDKCYGRS